jgi:gliding motility-associated-like protein
MNDKHKYIYPGTYKVSQTVVNDYDCENVMIKEVVISPEFCFWVPNVFTPTGDGLNDEFKPVTIGLTDYKMEIFSRDGLRLFTTYDLDKGWNGMYKGQPCKQDVYVWKINYLNELTKKPATKTGYVTLLNAQ